MFVWPPLTLGGVGFRPRVLFPGCVAHALCWCARGSGPLVPGAVGSGRGEIAAA